jgi:signal transduction histidine kinase
VEIAALLESVVAQSFACQVNIDLAADMPVLSLDATRLRLLTRNLLSNAVRYSDDAPPSLRARVADNTLSIEVQDSGEGINAQDIDKLTEPFYRVDPSRTRSTGGFGLGLYLCRLICEAHGGELLFASSPGVGTTVTATLKGQIAS